MAPVAISGLVLAGGASRRMGRDKALLPWDGNPLLRVVAARLAQVPAVSEVVVALGDAAREAAYRDAVAGLRVPVRFVADDAPGEGPVAGLAAGLAAARGELVTVAPVDAPGLSPAVSAHLLQRVGDHAGAVAEVDGVRQVLWGAYRPRAAAGFAAALEEGVRAAHEAVGRVDVVVVPEGEVRCVAGAGDHFMNLNQRSPGTD